MYSDFSKEVTNNKQIYEIMINITSFYPNENQNHNKTSHYSLIEMANMKKTNGCNYHRYRSQRREHTLCLLVKTDRIQILRKTLWYFVKNLKVS